MTHPGVNFGGLETSQGDNRLAPVVIFAHARLAHLQACVESLRGNEEATRTTVHIYCDGPRTPSQLPDVALVQEYARAVEGFAAVHVKVRETNLGLANSIIEGVTELLDAHGRLIVVEDDLVLSKYFLRYMNDGLDTYVDDPKVASIHGYVYPTLQKLPENFFLRGADCWGWATWKRAWDHFKPDGASLLTQLRASNLTSQFDFDGAYPFTRMLADQVAGRNDSWAIRWHASCFLAELLTLYPGRSLVHNSGHDSTGTHSASTNDFDQVAAESAVQIARIAVRENAAARRDFKEFFLGRKRRPYQRLISSWKNVWAKNS